MKPRYVHVVCEFVVRTGIADIEKISERVSKSVARTQRAPYVEIAVRPVTDEDMDKVYDAENMEYVYREARNDTRRKLRKKARL